MINMPREDYASYFIHFKDDPEDDIYIVKIVADGPEAQIVWYGLSPYKLRSQHPMPIFELDIPNIKKSSETGRGAYRTLPT